MLTGLAVGGGAGWWDLCDAWLVRAWVLEVKCANVRQEIYFAQAQSQGL